MVKISLRFLVVSSIAILALTGCAPAEATAGPTTSETSSASLLPTSTPTRPALTDLVISPAGLGPLRVGSPVPSASAETALVVWNATACVNSGAAGIAAGDPNAGAWTPTYPDTNPFYLKTTDASQKGNISVIRVFDGGIHTSTGIHVGSTKAELESAYSAFSRKVTGPVSDNYVIDGPTDSLSFEVSKQATDGGVDFWQADHVGLVLWMVVGPAGSTALPDASGDVAPSACPTGD